MRFTGIPAEAFDFYDGLAADNSKAFWNEHRDEYEECVRGPLELLGQELEPEFGSGHLYRPYRDVRFSKDKSPIKDHQGLFVEMDNGLGWYVQVSQKGLMAAGGWYSATPDQVARYRESVVDDQGGVLQGLVDTARAQGLTIGGDQLKTRPRGVAEDHPRLELLRHRSMYAWRQWEPAAWMGTRRALSRVTEAWVGLTPLMQWLSAHVGPGEAPTARRR